MNVLAYKINILWSVLFNYYMCISVYVPNRYDLYIIKNTYIIRGIYTI